MGENDGRARLYAGHDVEVESGKGYINGDSHIKITGGKGIRYVFGGGLAWNGTTSESLSFAAVQISISWATAASPRLRKIR